MFVADSVHNYPGNSISLRWWVRNNWETRYLRGSRRLEPCIIRDTLLTLCQRVLT